MIFQEKGIVDLNLLELRETLSGIELEANNGRICSLAIDMELLFIDFS